MMAAAAKPAGGKSAGGSTEDAEAAAPAPAQAPAGASTRPGALRIDAELAESHARRTGAAGGIGRLNGKESHQEAIVTRPPTQTTKHRNTNLAEGPSRGHESTREVGAGAELRVDAEVAESHARGVRPAVPATDGLERLRDRINNGRRNGITTRSNGRRPVAHGKKAALLDATPKRVTTTDGEGTAGTRDRMLSARGSMPGSSDADVCTGTSIDGFSPAANRIVGNKGKDSGAGAVTGAGTMAGSSEPTEEEQDGKRLRGCGGNEGGQEKKVGLCIP